MHVLINNHRRNKERWREFEKIGEEAQEKRKQTLKLVNKQCVDVLSSHKKISWLSLDLMRKKPRGYAKDSLTTDDMS
jgi:hypothetical protein